MKAEVKLLLALACGATAEQAARQAGVSVRTVYRRLKNQQFWRQVQAMRADMVQRASGTLTAASGEAVKTLLELLRAPTPFNVRLGAARGIWEIGMRVCEDVELEQRLATLEEQLAATSA
jgi:AcrR family transcriptional regulator